MKAVIVKQPGDETQLSVGEVEEPRPQAGELLVGVRAAGINRADLMQRQGLYPPPPGASPILGLECGGEVLEVGAGVSGWKKGDRVMALLPGGGYAEKAVVDQGSAMHVPEALSDDEAGALPEVFLTAYLNIFMIGGAQAGQTVLVQGGGSGVGTAAIHLLKEAGIRSIVTAGNDDKCQRCLALGADLAINYKDGPFAPKVKAATNQRGVDVVLDNIGAPYLAQHLELLARNGTLVLIGLMGGAKTEINLAMLMRNNVRLVGSGLRGRPQAEKRELVSRFMAQFGAALAAGRVKPQIDSVLPMAQAAEAHRRMHASQHFGKIVLRMA